MKFCISYVFCKTKEFVRFAVVAFTSSKPPCTFDLSSFVVDIFIIFLCSNAVSGDSLLNLARGLTGIAAEPAVVTNK